MKKVLAICLMVVMVVSMSINAFAAPGGFISSPSGNPAPRIISFDPSNEDCIAQLFITPYSDRHELSDTSRAMLEKAYDGIVASDDLADLNADLAEIAADKNISGKNLAVTDLFDMNVTGCENHDGHVDFDIALAADTLNRFIGLLYMDNDGAWQLVKDAAVVNNGEHLKFSVDAFGPFAIVVDTSVDSGDSPQTGDNSMIHIYVIIMAVSALAIIVITVMNKKQKRV